MTTQLIPRSRCYADSLEEALQKVGSPKEGKSPVVTCSTPFITKELEERVQTICQELFYSHNRDFCRHKQFFYGLMSSTYSGCGEQWIKTFQRQMKKKLDTFPTYPGSKTKNLYEKLMKHHFYLLKKIIEQASQWGKIGTVSLILSYDPPARHWHRDLDRIPTTGVKTRLIATLNGPATEFGLIDPAVISKNGAVKKITREHPDTIMTPFPRCLTAFTIATQIAPNSEKTGDDIAAWHRSPDFFQNTLRGLLLVDVIEEKTVFANTKYLLVIPCAFIMLIAYFPSVRSYCTKILSFDEPLKGQEGNFSSLRALL